MPASFLSFAGRTLTLGRIGAITLFEIVFLIESNKGLPKPAIPPPIMKILTSSTFTKEANAEPR